MRRFVTVLQEVAISMRDHDETWIRVLVKEGGIIVLPAGVYHHFTLDTDKYTELLRNFTPSILVMYNSSFVMFEREATNFVLVKGLLLVPLATLKVFSEVEGRGLQGLMKFGHIFKLSLAISFTFSVSSSISASLAAT
ncbi:hypothetical protein ACFE04_011296 [Oxalis oulophora]